MSLHKHNEIKLFEQKYLWSVVHKGRTCVVDEIE